MFSDLNELCTSKGDVVKESFSALLILLVESARHDLDSKVLTATLENYNFNPNRLNKIALIYDSKKLELKRALLQIKRHLPSVVDVNWRLDFCIRVCNFMISVFQFKLIFFYTFNYFY